MKVTREDFENSGSVSASLSMIGSLLFDIRDNLEILNTPTIVTKLAVDDDKLQRVKNRLAEKVTNENVDEIARSIVDIFEDECKSECQTKPLGG